MDGFFDVLRSSEARTATREAQRQNAARLAFSTHTQVSHGVGHFRLPDPIDFDVVFLEAPHVFTGAATVSVVTDAVLDPEARSGVWRWKRNLKGHYVGAYVYLGVRVDDEYGFAAVDVNVTVQHHLMFMGIAYKDLGSEVATEAQLLSPHAVGYGGL